MTTAVGEGKRVALREQFANWKWKTCRLALLYFDFIFLCFDFCVCVLVCEGPNSALPLLPCSRNGYFSSPYFPAH
jgi:hypothetical protein